MRQDRSGVDQEPLPRTSAVLVEGRRRGLHEVAAAHVRRLGEPGVTTAVGSTACGLADDHTLFSWTCATKPVLAMALGQLHDLGALDLADPLARWLPEAPTTWGPIGLTHLLTHTVGWIGDPGLVAAITNPREALEIVLATAELHPAWTPGERAAYSAWTGWLLLGEVARRAAQEPIEDLLGRILAKAGAASTNLGLDERHRAAVDDRWARLWHRGRDVHPYVFDSDEQNHRLWPGLSARGTVGDLVSVLEALALDARGAGPGILSPTTARRLVSPARVGLRDEASGMDHSWGLGLAVDRRAVHPSASAGTFSHAGIASSCLVFVDPERGVAAAYATDGITGGVSAMARRFALAQALFADSAALTASTATSGDPAR